MEKETNKELLDQALLDTVGFTLGNVIKRRAGEPYSKRGLSFAYEAAVNIERSSDDNHAKITMVYEEKEIVRDEYGMKLESLN